MDRDAKQFGREMRKSFEAQTAMFPRMRDESVDAAIRQYADEACGWKLSGAGGGGYLVLAGPRPIPGAIRLKIRRREF